MKKEENNEIVVDEKDIPEIVAKQIDHLNELALKVEEVLAYADKAKASAEIANNEKAGGLIKKAAIESLQKAAVDLAESQVTAAEAQKISFEYQEKLAEISRYLFALGVSNIATNRTVVRQLELKLKGASKGEISELAQKEIKKVIRELNDRKDLMHKQDSLSQKVKEHEKRLKDQEKKGTDLGDRIDSTQNIIKETDRRYSEHEALQDERLQEHDSLLEVREKKDQEHDRLLNAGKVKDNEQDQKLAEQVKKDQEHDRRLQEQSEKDIEHDQKLKEAFDKIKEQDERISELEEQVTSLVDLMQEVRRKSFSNTVGIITLVCALAGLVLGIAHFLL